ncbi:MAG: hypothetical protein AMXMBFR44_5980 [Candidatus Campbellbacteria bacterium]
MFKNIWDDLIAHAIRDSIAALLGKLGKEAVKTVATTTDSKKPDDQKKEKLDFNTVVNNDKFLPFKRRKILVDAINRLKTPDERDAVEQAIAEMFTQAKDGYLPPRMLTFIKKTTRQRKGGVTEVIEEPVQREAYPAGFEPESLIIGFLRSSTRSPEAADMMVSLLLREVREKNTALEAAKATAKEAADKAGKILTWSAKAYAIMMLALLVLSIVFWWWFVVSPGAGKLIVALATSALLTASFNIFRLVPGETK